MKKKKVEEEKDEPKLYRITLTEHQCQTMMQALEGYARMGIGQIDTAIEDATRFHFEDRPGFKKPDWQQKHAALNYAKKVITGFNSGESYGIGHQDVPDIFNAAWDMLQVIRHRVSWDNTPQGGMGVNFDKPMRAGKQDLIKIERIETEGERIIKKGF